MPESGTLKSTQPFEQVDRTPMPPRPTEELDLLLPNALRFVLEDLSAVLDIPLRNYLIVGRQDNGDGQRVDVDFAAFNGQRLGVSRYHAIIQVNHNRINIKDINSSNGTYLNGYSLTPMLSYRLRPGDELILGRLKVQVHFIYPR